MVANTHGHFKELSPSNSGVVARFVIFIITARGTRPKHPLGDDRSDPFKLLVFSPAQRLSTMGSDEYEKLDERLGDLVVSAGNGMDTGKQTEAKSPKFWYSNAIFFVGTHVAACWGMYRRPMWDVPPATLLLAFVVWQASCMGYATIYTFFLAGTVWS